MGPPFDDLPLIDYKHLVSVAHCREAVSDDKGCATLKQLLQRMLNQTFSIGIDVRRSFVKYENARIGQYRTCKSNQLPLALAQSSSAFTQLRAVAVRKRKDEIMYAHNFRCLYHLGVCGIKASITNIISYRAREKKRVLLDKSNLPA